MHYEENQSNGGPLDGRPLDGEKSDLRKMFSKATEYAIRAVIYIARKSRENENVGIHEIARAIDSPKPFTAKILQQLSASTNPVISSAKGPGGGFYITPEQSALPTMAIIKAMNEEGRLTSCIMGLSQCSDIRPCPLHSRYKTIKAKLVSMLETRTIKQISQEVENNITVINNRKSC